MGEAAKDTKITIRQPKSLKEMVRQAAAKRGMSVTSFINSTLEEAAAQTLDEVRRREVSERDQQLLLEMIQNPAGPNDALIRAAERYRARFDG